MTGTSDVANFLHWLEAIGPQNSTSDFGSIDSLDSFLLASIVEHEEVRALSDWEASLQDLWRGVFSAANAHAFYFHAFLTRGRAVPTVYPDRDSRRRLYKTGLPVSTATDLLQRLDSIRSVLSGGAGGRNLECRSPI